MTVPRPRRRVVEFVDTSILLELLAVPGRSSRPDHFKQLLRERVRDGRQLVLPTAAIIETGNHIHHLKDGHARRECAKRFAEWVELSARREAPWVLHDATWDGELLSLIVRGAGTGINLVEHATRGKDGLGTGDLSVLAERDLYQQRRVDPGTVRVDVWCVDQVLAGYC